MKKTILFAAALLLIVAANATVWNISPTNNPESPRTDCNLYVVLDRVAGAGDTILLADGVYDEPYSAPIKNPVVIMAAEGAKPVINNKGYFDVKASAKIIGLKFEFKGEANNGYGFYLRENTPKYLIVENCEFTAFTKYCITGSSSSAHADSVIVNNCYFHDNALSPIYFPASSLADNVNLCDYVKVTNSTFTNTTTLSGAGVIDNRNNGSSTTEPTSKLVVDHCTFYNCKGYERLIQSYKSPLAYVTNCIMANPLAEGEEAAIYATYLYGGEVHHNLNYQTKRQYGSGVTVTDSICRDPQFKDAANGDYTLQEGSPAIGAGTEGTSLGDPRWWPAAPAVEKKTLAQFNTDADKENAVVLEDLTVTYIYEYGKNVFVVDAEGTGGCIYDKNQTYITLADLKPGSVISGLKAKYDIYNAMPEIMPAEKPEAVSEGTAPAAAVLTAAPTISDACKLVKIESALVTKQGNNFYVMETVQLFDKFKLNYTVAENYTYDIVGIVIPYAKTGDPIIEICPTAAPENGTPSSLNKIKADSKAIKVIENGQIMILRDGKRYNMLGAEIK